MIVKTSDLILKILKNKGYKNPNDFVKKNGLKQRGFAYSLSNNCWTNKMLKQVGDALEMDLTRFENSKINRSEF